MKKKFAAVIVLLCVVFITGAGCSSFREGANLHGIEKPDTVYTGTDKQESAALQTVIIQNVTDDSLTVEHIILLNSYLEEDMKTITEMNIPPEEYAYGGYYRKDSGEVYTYDVDPSASVTIYDISQEYGAGEDRLYTFAAWRDFVNAVRDNETLLIQPYTLTLQDGVVIQIAEKFYN